MAKFDYIKWVTENKHGLLNEQSSNITGIGMFNIDYCLCSQDYDANTNTCGAGTPNNSNFKLVKDGETHDPMQPWTTLELNPQIGAAICINDVGMTNTQGSCDNENARAVITSVTQGWNSNNGMIRPYRPEGCLGTSDPDPFMCYACNPTPGGSTLISDPGWAETAADGQCIVHSIYPQSVVNQAINSGILHYNSPTHPELDCVHTGCTEDNSMNGACAQQWLPSNIIPNMTDFACTGNNTYEVLSEQENEAADIMVQQGINLNNFGSFSTMFSNWNDIRNFVNGLGLSQPYKGQVKRKLAKSRWAYCMMDACGC